MYSRILVPLDGSELSEKILPHASALAKSFGATLVLLRVTISRGEAIRQTVTSEPLGAGPLAVDVADNLVDAEDEAATRYLTGVRDRLQRDGIATEAVVSEGDAMLSLPDIVKAQRADLVAMATHGRTGLSRFFRGSVADSVLHDVRIPVLLLNAGD